MYDLLCQFELHCYFDLLHLMLQQFDLLHLMLQQFDLLHLMLQQFDLLHLMLQQFDLLHLLLHQILHTLLLIRFGLFCYDEYYCL